MSLPDRLHWLKRLRHSKVKFLFSGGGYCESPVQGPHTQPVAGLTGSGGVREGKTTAFEGACPGDNSVQGQQHVRELCVCNSVCAVNKGAEGKRRPFPKALFPPPPEKVDGDDDEETEEAKKKRMKELKKSVRQELKRGLAGVKTDEVEYGNYDDELSEEEEEEDVEEVSQCNSHHSPLSSLLLLLHPILSKSFKISHFISLSLNLTNDNNAHISSHTAISPVLCTFLTLLIKSNSSYKLLISYN